MKYHELLLVSLFISVCVNAHTHMSGHKKVHSEIVEGDINSRALVLGNGEFNLEEIDLRLQV